MKLFYLLIILISYTTVSPISACDETIKIDTVTYPVDSFWCGQKIDTTLLPNYEDLARISDSFSYKESKIYIRKEAASMFAVMARAALKDSIYFSAKSGYRSPGYQARMIKNRLMEGKTFEEVIRFVAPPGYSTHSVGNAVDIATDTYPFAESKAYQWLKKNARTYGFIEVYPKGNETLKTWEPWHWEFFADSVKLVDQKN